MNVYRKLMESLDTINEMEMPTYRWEDAIDQARDAISNSGSYETEMLIVQRIGDFNEDNYEVINADAYMHWSQDMREQYDIAGRVSNDGTVTEDYDPMQADEVPPAPQTDPMDLVTMDVPLMIRLFELMKETVQDDAELHEITTRILEVSKQSEGPLTMEDYNTILNGEDENVRN